MSEVRVTGLNIFPIKSCRGIALSELQIVNTGPRYDRGWMIVDQNNQFMTLRTQSKLSQIHTQITNENLEIQFENQVFQLNLFSESQDIQTVTVQDVQLKAGVESAEINLALSEYLKQNVKLVRYQKDSFRDLELAQTHVSKETMFVDSRPVLLTNEESLLELNRQLADDQLSPSSMDRYRANIIIAGLAAFKEETLKSIKIRNVELTNSKMCPRCVIVNMDYQSGEVVLKETLKYLPLHQTSKGPRITFGQYFTPQSLGSIRISDICELEF